jgi:hypothetical protein
VVGRGNFLLVLEGELVAVPEGSGSAPQSSHLVIVVGGLGNEALGGEAVGPWEGVELLEARVVEGRTAGLYEGGHPQ